MTVAELIEFLKTQPQHLPVAYAFHSEHSALHASDIGVETLQPARIDGHAHDARPDRAKVEYLVFPGN